METVLGQSLIPEEWKDIKHTRKKVNGLNMYVAELGSGTIVLLLHGFPELWYSWRHQIVFLAKKGYHVVAPDLRSYGGSNKDEDSKDIDLNDISKFSIHNLVGDVVALIDEITKKNEQKRVFVVGHDWGAIIAWHLCLFRPDKVRGLVALSVPFIPRDPVVDLVEFVRQKLSDDYYICRFQPQVQDTKAIENVLFKEEDMRTVLKRFFSAFKPGTLDFPEGEGFGNSHPLLPSWLKEGDLNVYAFYFQGTHLTGPINYYRALTKNWEDTKPWNGAKVHVPTYYIVGEEDIYYHIPGMKDYIENEFKNDVPSLVDKKVLPYLSHFIQQEDPTRINDLILKFIHTIEGRH